MLTPQPKHFSPHFCYTCFQATGTVAQQKWLFLNRSCSVLSCFSGSPVGQIPFLSSDAATVLLIFAVVKLAVILLIEFLFYPDPQSSISVTQVNQAISAGGYMCFVLFQGCISFLSVPFTKYSILCVNDPVMGKRKMTWFNWNC